MRFQLSISEKMEKALNSEKDERMLSSLQETMRSIIADYFVMKKIQIERQDIKRKQKKEIKSNTSSNPLIV